MHGAGIRAMGRLMDRIMATIDIDADDAPKRVRADLELIAPLCRWTAGTWEGLALSWNEIQNVSRHTNELSNYLIRQYVHAKVSQR
jgi:hypothetical protein